jgi:hypothetical protein
LTRAPMTPREVRRRYSNGRVFEVVFKNGYKKRGICAIFFGSRQLRVHGHVWRKVGMYHSRRAVLSRDVMRRIEGERGHCIRGWTRVLSGLAGRASDRQKRSLEGELA